MRAHKHLKARSASHAYEKRSTEIAAEKENAEAAEEEVKKNMDNCIVYVTRFQQLSIRELRRKCAITYAVLYISGGEAY